MKTNTRNFLLRTCAALLWLAAIACFESGAGGKIKGFVTVPQDIELSTAPEQARIFIYLVDYTSDGDKEVLPWQTPAKEVKDLQIDTLKSRNVAFEFRGLRAGRYGVSVLVDTGRPHVPKGSLNFTAFPGDYAGGTQNELDVEAGKTVEVTISEGLYVSIPDGYQAPLYADE